LATVRSKARTMQIWAAGTPKNFLECCAARASLSLTHVQCLYQSSGTAPFEPYSAGFVIRSGGGSASTRQQCGLPEARNEPADLDLNSTRAASAPTSNKAVQIRAFRGSLEEAGHTPYSTHFPLAVVFSVGLMTVIVAIFGRGSEEEDKIGFLGRDTRAIFGRSYAAEAKYSRRAP